MKLAEPWTTEPGGCKLLLEAVLCMLAMAAVSWLAQAWAAASL